MIELKNKKTREEKIKLEEKRKIVRLLRDYLEIQLPNKDYYLITETGDVGTCTRNTWADKNPNALAARVFHILKDLNLFPNEEQLLFVEDFWNTLTEEEKITVKDFSAEMEKRKSRKG